MTLASKNNQREWSKDRSRPKPSLAGHDIMYLLYYIMTRETTRGPCKSGTLGPNQVLHGVCLPGPYQTAC